MFQQDISNQNEGDHSYDAVDWIAYHARANPNGKATHELPSGRVHSFKQMHQRVGKLACVLRQFGVSAQDRVAFLMPNSSDIMDICFATWRLGGLVLALNHRLSGPELSYILEDAGARVVIYDLSLDALVKQIEAPAVRSWIGSNGDGSPSAFESAISTELEMITDRPAIRLQDACMLMYSSGTTGRPKGVIITHGMLHFSAVGSFGPCKTTSSSASLAAMPLFHIAAMNVSCLPLLAIGGKTVIMRDFDPKTVLRAMSDPELGITHFFAVPAAFNALRSHELAEASDFSRLETVIAGAETVPESLVQWWAAKGVQILEGYGLTETASAGCLLPHRDVGRKPGSTGLPTMYGPMKVMKNTLTEAAPGELGEIWVRGAIVTPGYWNLPDATQEAFHEGWFKTGDIGRKDDEGYLYIEDRLKDMYISGGENVYPAEIENVLYGHEDIAEVAVIGVPDSRWGEVGCAVIVTRPNTSVSASDVQSYCARQLARFKQPAHVALVTALPRNGTGKVLKHQLRKMIKAGEIRYS